MHTINVSKDELLWKQARRRVNFKRSLAIYVIMINFFWALWAFSDQDYTEGGNMPWPVWPMIGWGIGIAFQYYKAYMSNESTDVEREYEKLKNTAK